MALQKCIHLGCREKHEKAKEKANVFPRNWCKIFMVCTSNPLIENTSSAEGTSAGGTSAEMQHKEFSEIHANRNKI